jgi:hypothetical protein
MKWEVKSVRAAADLLREDDRRPLPKLRRPELLALFVRIMGRATVACVVLHHLPETHGGSARDYWLPPADERRERWMDVTPPNESSKKTSRCSSERQFIRKSHDFALHVWLFQRQIDFFLAQVWGVENCAPYHCTNDYRLLGKPEASPKCLTILQWVKKTTDIYKFRFLQKNWLLPAGVLCVMYHFWPPTPYTILWSEIIGNANRITSENFTISTLCTHHHLSLLSIL